MSVDIVGIGNQKMEYPNTSDESFDSIDEYLTIAKKTIRTFANRYRPGLAEEMLRSEDAISNVATSIMLGDWRWSPDYRSSDGKVRTKRAYRNQCAIWGILGYIGRKTNAPKLASLDKVLRRNGGDGDDVTLHEVIPSDELRPDALMIKEEESYRINKMLRSSCLTEKQQEYIRLYYIDNCTYQQIADRAGSSREAVRQTIDRGMKKVKNLGVN